MPEVKAPAYIDERRNGGIKILIPHGELKGDQGLAQALPAAIKTAAATGFDVVVNCSDVGGANSNGVKALIGACVASADMGPKIVLAGPVGALLAHLDHFHMRGAIPTFPTEDAAVATLNLIPFDASNSKAEIRRMLVETGLRRFALDAAWAPL